MIVSQNYDLRTVSIKMAYISLTSSHYGCFALENETRIHFQYHQTERYGAIG